jgi:hypothetical protein
LPAQVLFRSIVSDLAAMLPIAGLSTRTPPFHDESANNARLVSIRIRFARYSAEA